MQICSISELKIGDDIESVSDKNSEPSKVTNLSVKEILLLSNL